MIDVKSLQALIPLLHSNGVSRIKTRGFEIEFHRPYDTKATVTDSQAPQSFNETKVEAKVDPAESAKATEILNKQLESQLPVDLRTDNINSIDKILHWSSGDGTEPNAESVPLTDDKPLDSQV